MSTRHTPSEGREWPRPPRVFWLLIGWGICGFLLLSGCSLVMLASGGAPQ